MAESTRLVDLVQESIDEFLIAQEPQLTTISADLLPYLEFSHALLRGGKRFRALFCYWGWEAVTATDRDSLGVPASVVDAASALEMFHAAALVHDDIIDNSDTRRGQPAAHRRFQRLHSDAG